MSRVVQYLLAMLLLIPWLQPSNVSAAEEQRVVWAYQTEFGERRFELDESGEWAQVFANGNRFACEEVARTEQHIEIRNLKNKNVFRLLADRGTQLKAGTGPFRKFATGNWVAVPSTPTDDYQIKLAYFVPRDRTPSPGYEPKIRATMELALEMFIKALKAGGAETEGPRFERNESGEIIIRLIRGAQNARHYSGLPQEKSPTHAKFVAEAVEGEMGDTHDYAVVIFSETYETGPSPKVFPGVTNVALARPPRGGRVVVTAWMLQDEFCAASEQALRHQFFDATPVPGRGAYGVKAASAAKGEFMEEAYGAIVHELGHLFGCWHHRTADTNIMGGGFRDIRWNAGVKRNPRAQAGFSRENIWLMMTSRFLNDRVDRTDNIKPSIDVQMRNSRDSIVATIKASDNKGLAFAAVVDDSADDGLLMLKARKLEGTNQEFRVSLRKRDIKSINSKLMFVAIDTGGNFRRVTKPLSIASQ